MRVQHLNMRDDGQHIDDRFGNQFRNGSAANVLEIEEPITNDVSELRCFARKLVSPFSVVYGEDDHSDESAIGGTPMRWHKVCRRDLALVVRANRRYQSRAQFDVLTQAGAADEPPDHSGGLCRLRE